MRRKSLPLAKVYQLIEPGPVVMVATRYKDHADIMSMAWHTMIEFEPPIIACVISNRNYSFDILRKTKECTINIPSADMVKKVVGCGSITGAKLDKFKKFALTAIEASTVTAPLIAECFANLECKVIDSKLVTKYNLFFLEVTKAWISTARKRYKTLHHHGHGRFVIDGDTVKLPFNKP